MTRVNINGAGHQVEVDHDGADLTYVVEKAQKLWTETKPVDKTALGFSGPTMEQHRGHIRTAAADG